MRGREELGVGLSGGFGYGVAVIYTSNCSTYAGRGGGKKKTAFLQAFLPSFVPSCMRLTSYEERGGEALACGAMQARPARQRTVTLTIQRQKKKKKRSVAFFYPCHILLLCVEGQVAEIVIICYDFLHQHCPHFLLVLSQSHFSFSPLSGTRSKGPIISQWLARLPVLLSSSLSSPHPLAGPASLPAGH